MLNNSPLYRVIFYLLFYKYVVKVLNIYFLNVENKVIVYLFLFLFTFIFQKVKKKTKNKVKKEEKENKL